MDSSNLRHIVDDNLSYMQSLIHSQSFDVDFQADLAEELASLIKQAESDELKLAIFGEFNTGKSTFINALLGQDILTAQRRPTTQVCIYIRHGKELAITATLPNTSKQVVPLEQVADFISENGSMKQTTRVDITTPSEALKSGLVIVDTPGINVDIHRHIAITEKALQEANACIFMMSARQPGSRTSVDYLRRISSCVDKFFLVLNMCDLLDEDELTEAVDYLRDVLRDECGIKEPRVYPISSIRDTGSKLGPGGSGFREFTDRLSVFMKTDKQIILAREVAKLQERIMTKASAMVHNRRRHCEEELQRRWEQAMPDSETLVRNLNKTTMSDVTASLSEVNARSQAYARDSIKGLRAAVEGRISSVKRKGEFKKDVPEYIQSKISSTAQSFGSWLTTTKNDQFTKIVGKIDSQFDQLFANVKNISLKLMIRDPLLYWLTILLALIGGGISWFLWESNNLTAISTIAGAIVGYIVFYCIFISRIKSKYWIEPVSSERLNMYIADRLAVGECDSTAWEAAKIGLKPTLFWGTRGLISSGDPTMLLAGLGITALLSIGGAIWDKIFGPSLDQVKNDIRQKVAPILDKFEANVYGSVNAEMQALKITLPSFCKERINQLDIRYESIIMELAARDRGRIADVETRVNILAEIESDLAQRSDNISRELVRTRKMLSQTS